MQPVQITAKLDHRASEIHPLDMVELDLRRDNPGAVIESNKMELQT